MVNKDLQIDSVDRTSDAYVISFRLLKQLFSYNF